MENQHRKITGYRELNQHEIDLMNAVKLLGKAQEEMLLQIQEYIKSQRDNADSTDIQRMENATPERFAALAKTEFQTGLMYLTRAVAQPEFF